MSDEQRGEPDPDEGGSTPPPEREAWDPWRSGWASSGEPTTPLDLDRTQEVDLGGTPPTGPMSSEPAPAPGVPTWATVRDQPMPAAPTTAPGAAYGGYPPASTYGPAPSGAAPAPAWGPPAARGSGSQRRGPGWGALIGIAAAVALVAGLGGGLLGGWVANGDRSAVSSGGTGAANDPGTVPTPGPAVTERPTDSVASIAARALPSVVTIRVSTSNGGATGSGWVYDTGGHVVTNNHVVSEAGDGGSVTVLLSNGKQVSGSVVGSDASYDLAVVQLERTDLKPLTVGVSADVVVGDPVIAVGAPLGLDSTVTTGIVSALNRPVSPGGDGGSKSFINAIQTDAAINPGNSGGPLLDMRGQVIGVNAAIAQLPSTNSSSTGSIGLGFAIPSDQVKKTVDQLIASGHAQHPIIGVLMDLNYSGEGVRIAGDDGGTPAITPDGPADKAGLKPGDIILEFEGRPITDPNQLVVAVRARSVGDKVTLLVRRNGTDRKLTLTLQASE